MSGGIDYYLTAEEAWPAFEREMLRAERRVVAGFRIFDPATKLRSGEGREVGEDWFDLILHILGKGVTFDMILADFDPIIAPDMHETTWASLRKFAAIEALAGEGARLNVIPAMHPAEAGSVARTALWPKVWQELHDLRDILNGRDPEAREQGFRDVPGTHRWLTLNEEGLVETQNLSPPPLNPVTHHQKLAVFDERTLYIGGLDLNPRRYDTPVHHRAGEETWHDVQMMVHDSEAARAAALHLDTMMDTVKAEGEPPEEGGGFALTLSRWRSNVVTMAPEVVRTSIADRHYEEIARAEDFLYFETQFFRDRKLAEAIAERGREVPDLRLLMILPAAPEDVAFDGRRKLDSRYGEWLQTACVDMVQEAFGDRCYFASPAQQRAANPGYCEGEDRSCHHGAPLIYVHAKVSVFDRRAVMVSSANLNARSLRWDTEAGLLRHDAEFAREVLGRSMAHWLPKTQIDITGDMVAQVRDQAELDVVRQPENREGFLLPYDVGVARDFGTYLPGIPDELV